MKRFLLATTALALCEPAFAADMPVKAPAATPAYSWTSCHLGGQMGVAWGRANITDPNSFILTPGIGFVAPTGGTVGVNQDGGIGGVQLGCDYEFANHWVIGAAGDFSFADIKNQVADPFFVGKGGNPIQIEAKTEWLASATARLGYAWDRWMLYGKGGAAWSRDRYNVQNNLFWGTPGNLCVVNTFSVACNATGSATLSGWTAGVGVTYAVTDAWSLGLEYDHYGFGKRTVLLTDPTVAGGSPSTALSIGERIDAVKVTVDYHFGPGRP